MSESTIDTGIEFDFGPSPSELVADGVIRTQLDTASVAVDRSFDASEGTSPVSKLFAYLDRELEESGKPAASHYGHFGSVEIARVAVVTDPRGEAVLYAQPAEGSKALAMAHALRRSADGSYALVGSYRADSLSEIQLRTEQPIVHGWASKDYGQGRLITRTEGVLHDHYKTMRTAVETGRKRGLGRFFVRR